MHGYINSATAGQASRMKVTKNTLKSFFVISIPNTSIIQSISERTYEGRFLCS